MKCAKNTFWLVLCLCSSLSGFAQLVPLQYSTQNDSGLKYYLYAPSEEKESYPLVVFLHGGGESGDNLELVKKHGPPKLISEGQDFSFYMFAPQNPYKNGLWDDRAVDEVVDHLIDSLNIDDRRVYLVGLSRGGYGVWRMAINNPDKYAAMISICAASIPMIYVDKAKDIPIWFFHGKKDNVVPVEQTISAYEKLKELNADVKITIYPDAKHDSWTETFENDEIYRWLLSKSK